LTGPAGFTGSQGAAGAQGTTGQTGEQGFTAAGGAGATGVTGPAGTQGSAGTTGARGPVGIVDRWTTYRVIYFDSGRSDLSPSDKRMVSEIAAYMAKNPSLQAGLDGYRDPRNQSLSERRVTTVRDALMAAGVPSSKIQTGAFGDPNLRSDRRVEVLLSTAAVSQSSAQ
jgi:outer membrane protein OmpA-like peptidoglycan-associated protein